MVIAQIRNYLGKLYTKMRKLEDAERELKISLQIKYNIYPPESKITDCEIGRSLYNIGCFYEI